MGFDHINFVKTPANPADTFQETDIHHNHKHIFSAWVVPLKQNACSVCEVSSFSTKVEWDVRLVSGSNDIEDPEKPLL